jgi:hypothetical protein
MLAKPVVFGVGMQGLQKLTSCVCLSMMVDWISQTRVVEISQQYLLLQDCTTLCHIG